MKLHLPDKLRAALLACFTFVATTVGSASADYEWSGGASFNNDAWNTHGNWTLSETEDWDAASCANTTDSDTNNDKEKGPGVPGSNEWNPIVIDNEATGSVSSLEGWTLNLTVTGGSNLTIDNLKKMQGGTVFNVGDNSSLKINFKKSSSGTDDNNVDINLTGSGELTLNLYADKSESNNTDDITTVDYGTVSGEQRGVFTMAGFDTDETASNHNYYGNLILKANIGDTVSETTTLHTLQLASINNVTVSSLGYDIGGAFLNSGSTIALEENDANIGLYSIVHDSTAGTYTLYYVTGAKKSLSLTEGTTTALSTLTSLPGSAFGGTLAVGIIQTPDVSDDAAHLSVDKNFSLGTLAATGGALSVDVGENFTLELGHIESGEGASVAFTGRGTLCKTGSGEMTLSDLSGFTGTLAVADDPSSTSSNSVTLDTNATLAGLTLGNNSTLTVSGAGHTVKIGNRADGSVVTIANGVRINIAEGATLKVAGIGNAGASKFEGAGTLRFDAGATSTHVISSTGNNFTGTLDIVSGLFRLGAISGDNGKGVTDFNAGKILVHGGATFQTNNGKDSTSPSTASINSTLYTENGSILNNLDGHSKWAGTIHLNVSDLGSTDPTYNTADVTTMHMYWAKYVTWDALVKGAGTLQIEGGHVDGGNAHRLVLNHNGNTFSGTYKLVGKNDFLMELYLNQANAAQNAIINIDASNATAAGTTNLLVGANATIAGLMGTAKGVVKADGGARTLTINQSAKTKTEFKGTIKDGAQAAHVLSITKEGDGTLTLSGANTYTGATTVSGGTLRLAGEGGKAGTGAITVAADATLELAHTAAFETTNAITLNGNLLVSGVDETVTSALTLASGKTMTIKENASLTLSTALTNNGNITLESESTLTLGGTVNITNRINNDAGTLVLQDGVVLKGITSGRITVAKGESLTYVGASSTTYATETDLSQLATNTQHVTVNGSIARDFSDVTFQNGSTLVIGNGQTVTSAPTIAENASITLEVGKNETGTWSAAAQPSNTTVSISTVNIGAGGTLTAYQANEEGGRSAEFCSFNHNRDKSLSINLAATPEGGKVTTLETHGSIFGWDPDSGQAERTVNLGKGSQWLLHAVVDDQSTDHKGEIWFNQTTTVLDNAQVTIDEDATVSVERFTSRFKTETTSAGQSTISGGIINLKLQSRWSNTKLVFDVDRSTALGESSTADLLVSSVIIGQAQNNIEKNGTGILELTANNTFTSSPSNGVTGGIDVKEGTLRLAGEGGKAGNGPITVAAGATLELKHTKACETDNAITLNGGNLLVSGAYAETLSGSITGRGNLTVGNGSLTLSGASAVSLDTICVSSGAGMTIVTGKTVDVLGTICSDGTLTVNGSIVMNNADHLEGVVSADGTGGIFSDGANGTYLGGEVYVVKGNSVASNSDRLGGTGTITIGTDTYYITPGENQVSSDNFTWDQTTGVLTYNDQSATHETGAYYINTDVTYGAVDNTAASDTNVTKLILNGGTLTITSATTLNKDVEVQSDSTLHIEAGATVDSARITGGSGNVYLDGFGGFNLGANLNLPNNVQLNPDWTGTVYVKNKVFTGNSSTLDNLANAKSWVGLSGCSGWLTLSSTIAANLLLENSKTAEGEYLAPAVELTAASNQKTQTFSGSIKGRGNFVLAMTGPNQEGTTGVTYVFSGDVSEWTGTFASSDPTADPTADSTTPNKTFSLKFTGTGNIGTSINNEADRTLEVTIGGAGDRIMSGSITNDGTLNLTVEGDGTKTFKGTQEKSVTVKVTTMNIQEGTLAIGDYASVTAGGITATTNSANPGTAKKVTIGASGITGATSGDGDTLKTLGEMSGMTLAFVAENTAADIRNVTMRDVKLVNGAVSMNGVVAIASSFAAEQAGPAPARMMALSAEADTGSAGTQTLTANPVKSGGSISGTLTVDIDGSILSSNAGNTLSWTILQGVSLAEEEGASFTLKLGDVLTEIVRNGKPTVTLSGAWVNNNGTNSVDLTSANWDSLSTGNLLAASVTGGNLVLTIENVPEPTTGTLSVLALAALAARRRRRE